VLALSFAVVLPPAGSLAQVVKTAKPAPKSALHPRSLEEIKKALDAIYNAPPPKTNDPLELERDQALRRLKAYRYLAEVPYQNLSLDPEYNKLAQGAALVCEKLGKLDHKPANPGLPEAEYQVGLKGAGSSNLGMGYRSIAQSVDGYMDDSDPGNIQRVGHRRWCLNPTMMKAGFGKSGKFYGMYVFDRSQPQVPNFDVICYPSRGFQPVDYFRPNYAWSVTLHPAKFKIADPKGVKPSIYVADEKGNKAGDALKLNFQRASTESRGMGNCIIFRPEKLDMSPGKRYLVEIDGLVGINKGPLKYMVEFVSLR
jgi:hypothetical protein